jgi:DNA-binding NtrC family response regulator
MAKTSPWAAGRVCLAIAFPPSSAVLRALGDFGLEIEKVESEIEALAALERRAFAVILVGPRMTAAEARALLARTTQKKAAVPVVILAGNTVLQEAVDCMQLGAADYLAPPFHAEAVVNRLRRLLDPVAPGKPGSEPKPATLEPLGIIGKSATMARLFSTIEKVSRYKANVLLLGESGSGKELIARALHARGPRRQHLFVPINCATLGRDLLENELFGHERGAFTGAHERKRGLFELADGGTLFLDEIGELDPSTQAKLLRVLERNAFRRVGGTALVHVNLSVVAATNRNLEEAIAAKRFREDLYYRLKVVTIVVPPLRERREDIPALVEAFIADFNRRNDGKIRGVAPLAMHWLTELPWLGNVRELKNTIESAAMLAASETIGLEELESTTSSRRGAVAPVARGNALQVASSGDVLVVPAKATLAEVERLVIGEHVKRTKTRAEAAHSLGIGLRTLYSKSKRYRLGTPHS